LLSSSIEEVSTATSSISPLLDLALAPLLKLALAPPPLPDSAAPPITGLYAFVPSVGSPSCYSRDSMAPNSSSLATAVRQDDTAIPVSLASSEYPHCHQLPPSSSTAPGPLHRNLIFSHTAASAILPPMNSTSSGLMAMNSCRVTSSTGTGD